MNGKVHVYTGNGKGKTTSALGLAMRAVGANMNVFIGQFAKGRKYSELKSLKDIENIEVEQFGQNYFIKGKPTKEDINSAKKGFEKIKKILKSGKYEVVILDEANIATFYNLFSTKDLIQVIDNRAKNVEVIITGRMADQKIIDYADLVTEMKEIKHYYQQGVIAREGIEM
jgi:cob(I)alamin adenosyltransferase